MRSPVVRFALVVLVLTSLGAGCSDYGVWRDDKHSSPPDSDPPVDTGDPVTDTFDAPPDTDDTQETDDTEDTEDTEDTTPPDPEVGCSDGTREGYQDQGRYPSIAACSGGWQTGGVTVHGQTATCGRNSGNSSSNPDGTGCTPTDLCEEGWHVCDGHIEVESLAGSCDDAVPAGTPDKMLLFAVHQHSDNNSECNDATTNGNDVFGCGNLGTTLDTSRNCGVLNKVLASMQANTCGFNEAEPPLGPWECKGGTDSHYHEGELVTKYGCKGNTCNYDRWSGLGNSDKGGVICCRD